MESDSEHQNAKDAVVSSARRRVRTQSSYCAAANCNNSRTKRPDISFFKFPKDPERFVFVLIT